MTLTWPISEFGLATCCRQDQLEQIAKKLEGPLVVQKGAKDGISDGQTTIYCEGGGSKRRAGGQVCPALQTHAAFSFYVNTDYDQRSMTTHFAPAHLGCSFALLLCHICLVALTQKSVVTVMNCTCMCRTCSE